MTGEEKRREEEDGILYQYTIPKAMQIVLKPKPEWAIKIRAFRELCTRNGLSMSEELFNRGIESFLKDHNWPPGNSQTLLFQNQSKNPLCKCGKKASRRVVTTRNATVYCCSLHMPHDVLRWKEVKK